MAPNPPTAYAVHLTEGDDPCTMYLIDPGRTTTPRAPGGRDLTPLQERHWYAGPEGLTEVELPLPPLRIVTGYRLRDGYNFPGWPAAMTADEARARRAGPDEDAREWAFYEEEFDTEERPPDVVALTPINLAELSLEDRPMPWRANLPWAAKDHPQLRRGFPGQYVEVRAWLQGQLEVLPQVRHCFLARGATGERYATVDLKLAPTEHTPARGRRGSKNYKPAVTTRSVRIPLGWVPDEVKGAHADAAWRAVEELRDRVIAEVSLVGVSCPTCGGSGILPELGDAERPG
ncbi:MAG TPA: hypothetical protein VMW08_00805 [Acidimicrobiales bacterium]|nr:hypothetical protein [Acidimicrobiales bacterium]